MPKKKLWLQHFGLRRWLALLWGDRPFVFMLGATTCWAVLKFTGKLLPLWCVCLMFLGLQGCAVGRNDATGEIVLGFGAGKLVETVNQAAGALIDPMLAAAGIGVPGLGAIAVGWARSAIKSARREGEASGWDQREQAAAVQQPLPANRTAATGAPAAGSAGGTLAASSLANDPDITGG